MSPFVTLPPSTWKSCGKRANAMRPGRTRMKTGSTLRKPAKMVPAFA
jgi:hypothetical protein